MRIAAAAFVIVAVACTYGTPTDIILHGDVCATWDSMTVNDTLQLEITIHEQCLTVEPVP